MPEKRVQCAREDSGATETGKLFWLSQPGPYSQAGCDHESMHFHCRRLPTDLALFSIHRWYFSQFRQDQPVNVTRMHAVNCLVDCNGT